MPSKLIEYSGETFCTLCDPRVCGVKSVVGLSIMIHSELALSVPADDNQSIFPVFIKLFLIMVCSLVASKVPAIGQPLPGSGPKSPILS